MVPGRRVMLELKNTSSPLLGGQISFEIGIVDYDARCRIDFEDYVIHVEEITGSVHEAFVAALAHYQATLLEHGVVGDWVGADSGMCQPQSEG